MAVKIKLIKGLSYHGANISATASSPYVTVSDEKAAKDLAATGYFQKCENPAPKSEAKKKAAKE